IGKYRTGATIGRRSDQVSDGHRISGSVDECFCYWVSYLSCHGSIADTCYQGPSPAIGSACSQTGDGIALRHPGTHSTCIKAADSRSWIYCYYIGKYRAGATIGRRGNQVSDSHRVGGSVDKCFSYWVSYLSCYGNIADTCYQGPSP